MKEMLTHPQRPRDAREANENIPAGTEIGIVKRSLEGNARSAVAVGKELRGVLLGNIEPGKPIHFRDGSRTSKVQSLYREGRTLFAKTETSIYELITSSAEFRGLTLKNQLGEISLPEDASEAQLGGEVVDLKWRDEIGNVTRAYINKPALQGVLLEVHNGEIFRAMGGRLMVVARVGNIHVPFYISSQGTSGKRKGEWYPFFGYTGDWLVKGGITDKGDMLYHPEISRVQDLLNQNLMIPMDFLSPKGKMGTGKDSGGVEPANVLFDIGRQMKYQNVAWTEYGQMNDGNKAFLERLTGYKPEKVKHYDGSSHTWIEEIASHIRT